MTGDLGQYDLSTLRALYEEERSGLTEALLKGSTWEKVQDKRRRVTELSIAIHKKVMGVGNPAEVPGRNADN